MRGLLTTAGGWQNGDAAKPDFATITPWALIEAEQPAMIHRPTRQALFADAKLTLLYSGNMGRAHDLDLLLALARVCQAYPIGFCFAGRGPGTEALKSKLTIEDTNVTLADFASESELHARLSAGDVHMVSLKESWTGTVVPSKFFGALAMGRPVLFAGSAESSIAKWIKLHQVGWHLTSESLSEISAELIALVDRPQVLDEKNRHCWEIYRQYFSREVQLSKWQEVVARPAIVYATNSNAITGQAGT